MKHQIHLVQPTDGMHLWKENILYRKMNKNSLKNINFLLNKYYYDIKEPSSFQSANKIQSVVKNYISDIKLNDIKNWLLKQDTHGIHKPIKLHFKRNPIVSKTIDHNWHADLIEITNPAANSNYRYILMVIDNLSKYGWAEKIKSKRTNTVLNAFKRIGRKSKRKPNILTTDAGKEFTNHKFKKFLKKNKIKHLIARDGPKAAVVERWNRTIKEKISKYLTYNKSKRFVDVLDLIVKGYNNTIHSRTKYKPIDINKSNEKIVFNNLYKNKTQLEKQLFTKGDRVRVVLIRGQFQKGYIPNFSKEIFYVHKILYTSPYYKYKVKDKKGVILRVSYYSKELLKV